MIQIYRFEKENNNNNNNFKKLEEKKNHVRMYISKWMRSKRVKSAFMGAA